MNDPNWISAACAVVSVISTIVVILVDWRRHVRSEAGAKAAEALAKETQSQFLEVKRQLLDIQQRQLLIEERREKEKAVVQKRASLRSELVKQASGSYQFVTRNIGEADARSVKFYLDNVPLEKHECLLDKKAAPSAIPSKSKAQCLLCFDSQCAPPFNLRMTWEDDSEQPGVLEMILNW